MSNVLKHYPNVQKFSLHYVTLLIFLEINAVVKPCGITTDGFMSTATLGRKRLLRGVPRSMCSQKE